MLTQPDRAGQDAAPAQAFQRELTEAARLRWGEQRAAELAEPIALMAQALADLAGASFTHDAVEPDFVDCCRDLSELGRLA